MATQFMPHGMCYLWQPGLIGVMVTANALTALAYYAIPLLLFRFIGRRPDIPNPLLFALFAIFILACGTTHLLNIVTIWHPVYWVAAFFEGLTATASVATVLIMASLMPRLLRSGTLDNYLESSSRSTLSEKNAALEAANERLERLNADQLERLSLLHRSADLLSQQEQRIKELSDENERLRGPAPGPSSP